MQDYSHQDDVDTPRGRKCHRNESGISRVVLYTSGIVLNHKKHEIQRMLHLQDDNTLVHRCYIYYVNSPLDIKVVRIA